MSEHEDWGSEDEEDRRGREMKNMKTSLHKMGYVDGIEKGKEDALQVGFDDGFKTFAHSSLSFGNVLGSISVLLHIVSSNEKKEKVQTLLTRLHSVKNDTGEILPETVHSLVIEAVACLKEHGYEKTAKGILHRQA